MLSQFTFTQNSFAYKNLPECTSDTGTLMAGAQPRKNCWDLKDLPLCSLFTGAVSPITIDITDTPPINQTYKNTINCVKECSDPLFNDPNPNAIPKNVRGIDYAVHNKHCIRFCPPPGTTNFKENNEDVGLVNGKLQCTSKQCHQLSASETPSLAPPLPNCTLTPCNLLTLEELRDNNDTVNNKFNNDSKQYCESAAKCYEFDREKLQYTRYRLTNPMCKIHDCAPNLGDASMSNSTCNAGVDDGSNVKSKGPTFVDSYKQYIDPNFDAPGSFCKPINCKPVYYRTYRCTPEPVAPDTTAPSTRNPLCDIGESCDANGYCRKKIDCNISANINENECSPNTYDDSSSTPLGAVFNDHDSWLYRPHPDSDLRPNIDKSRLCYSKDAMYNNGWGKDWEINVGLFKINLGFFHIWPFDDAIPAGNCTSKLGFRGPGYLYMCGVNGVVNEEPDDDAAYVNGYVTADFISSPISYNIEVCARYKNIGRLESCGERRCFPDCAFGICGTQWCGFDVCKTLTVYEGSEGLCTDPRGVSDSGLGDHCWAGMGGGASIDSHVRVRAAKYGRRVCTFLDVRGPTAYDDDYMGGNDRLDDGECIDGSEDEEGECNGRNSNADRGLASIFRAIRVVDYITNDPADTEELREGYTNLHGRFYKAQQCALAPLRIGPQRHYTIGNGVNSENLFAPPLWISKVKEIKGGADSTNGKTDFHYPEIEVSYGKEKALLSLSNGNIGDEDPVEATSKTILTAMVGDKPYTANILIRKTFNTLTNKPILCLFRQQGIDGAVVDKKIACIDRNKPEINNTVAGNKRKAILTANPANTYNFANFSLQLLASTGANGIDNNCLSSSDDSCSIKVDFVNPGIKDNSCQTIEKHEFCAQKEPCTELLNECIQNEISLSGLSITDSTYSEKRDVKERCDTILLDNCNTKWGITSGGLTDVSALISDLSASSSAIPSMADSKAYGWFNETCVTKGFEDKLIKVITHRALNGTIKGKCLTGSVNSSSCNADDIACLITSITSGVNNANTSGCAEGGNAKKNCNCIPSLGLGIEELGLDPDIYEIRTQTLREAGLCIDIPYPKICPAIIYEKNISNPNDINFILHSVNKTSYNNSTGVHTAHQNRSNDTNALGHAEFNATFSGVNNFEGQCNGFWKSKLAAGVELKPILNCKSNGEWDKASLNNVCERYSCPEKTTIGMRNILDESGSYVDRYPGDYATGEVGILQGSNHGFANWPQKDKTNDFLQTVTATSCVPGYKKVNNITPTRDCNQVGQWLGVNNPCERILCTDNPPANPTTQADFNKWIAFGGATFPTGKASRSTTTIIGDETIKTGACNTALRFYQAPGNPPPQFKCDHTGKWVQLDYSCVTSCDAVATTTAAETIANGYSFWPQVSNVPIGGQVTAYHSNCVNASYVKSPYSPKSNPNIFNNGGVPTTPSRTCVSVATSTDPGRNIWGSVSDPCVNYCPGHIEDPRIGVGRTTHPTSGGQVTVNWAKTNLGDWAYSPDPNSYSAANFADSSITSSYFLKRKCGMDGKWENPIALCSTTNGQVGNANYNGTNSGNNNHLEAGSATELTAYSCITGYGNNANGPAPVRQCIFKDATKNINEVYLALKSGSQDCEEVICSATQNAKIKVGTVSSSATDAPLAVVKTTYCPFDPGTYTNCYSSAYTTTPVAAGLATYKEQYCQDYLFGGCCSSCVTTYEGSNPGISLDVNVIYKGSTTTKKLGETLPVSCEDAFIQTGTASMVCQQDRTWAVQGANCRRGKACTSGADDAYDIGANSSGCGDGGWAGISGIINMRHNQVMNVFLYDNCDDCSGGVRSFKCNDGTLQSVYKDHGSACDQIESYNWDSSAWYTKTGITNFVSCGNSAWNPSFPGTTDGQKRYYYNNQNEIKSANQRGDC